MPIVTIEAVNIKDESAVRPMLSEIQRIGARALNCSESNIWVVFKPLEPDFYIQAPGEIWNEQAVMVTIKAQTGRTKDAKNAFVKGIAEAIATTLFISSKKVWIYYQEMNPQDIWFDDRWTS